MASSQTLGDALKRVARYSQITNEALVVGYRETRCTGPTPPVAVSRLSHAAKVAAIHHGDAGLEHGMDGRDGFRVAGVPIAAHMPMTPGPFRPNRTSRISISPDFRARNSEQMVSEFVARHVSPM